MAAPKLRFKEFDGDLAESKLVDSTSWGSGGTPAKNIPEYWGDDIPLISGASMHTNQLYESDVKITKLGLQKGSKLAPKDSILILVRGSMLFNKIPMGITLGDVAFNQDVKCIRPKQELAPLFLFQWLHAKENIIQNKVTATGIGAGKLDTADLQNLKLYKPSSEEQTKIASFLSTVDEKISQLTQKHELLNQYKQGMKQKLFSQQIRFKADDGSEFGEWEEKLIKDIADVKGGKRIPKGYALVNENTGHPYITVSDMNRSYSIDRTNIRYVPLEVVDTIKRYTIIDKDIFISVAGTLGIIGKIPTEFNGANLTENADKLTNLKCHQDFLIYLLDSGYLSELIESTATTSAQPKLALYAIEQLEIQIPCLEEQTKIANFLSAIDQKIEVVAQQIEQAKTWKKGLLQQMFV
ncbi:restriction endonuclease subunit S [Acinetobacter johnsonii]|uniref:restriction endonuclease subunit S n=1 Tax=Acinetobacter johnsonii TaxID=40214 RepID=UPI0029360237|nr:restriction endonuclease subunit S [Acinetobacter johnsonii]MDV2488802.1 restriction endonuclease subunit S [Acinetobacter johnsonii]